MKRRDLLALAASATAGVACGATRGVPLWFSYGGKNREALLALVAKFNAEQPAHALAPVYQGDYFELLAKLRTAMHAGVPPAVTHVVAEILPYLVGAGVLERLDALPGLDVDLGFVPELTQRGAFAAPPDLPIYGVPFNRSTPIAYFNGNLLGELGLSPPTTWDELRAFARAATRGEGSDRLYGFSCPIDWWFWVALVGQAGGDLVDESGRFTLGGDAGVRALSLWQELAAERVMMLPSGRDYNAWQVTNTEFLAGRVAMIWTSTAFVRYLEDTAKFPVVAAPLPRDQRFAVPTGGTMFVVPAPCPPPFREAAAQFLAFMARPVNANEFATRTGYIPVSRQGTADLVASGFYDKHPNDHVAVRQLEHVRPWPWHPSLFRVQREVVQSRLESAVLKGEDARAVLSDARRLLAEDP